MSRRFLSRPIAGFVLVLIFVVAWVRLPWAWPSYRNMANALRDIYAHRNASLPARLETLHGMDWRLLETVRESMPPSARILIPSGPRHGQLSSRLWCTYYLYPRRLVYESELTGPVPDQVDYILVDRGWGLSLGGIPADSIKGTETGLLEVR